MMSLYHSMGVDKIKNEKKGVGYVKPNPSFFVEENDSDQV